MSGIGSKNLSIKLLWAIILENYVSNFEFVEAYSYFSAIPISSNLVFTMSREVRLKIAYLIMFETMAQID